LLPPSPRTRIFKKPQQLGISARSIFLDARKKNPNERLDAAPNERLDAADNSELLRLFEDLPAKRCVRTVCTVSSDVTDIARMPTPLCTHALSPDFGNAKTGQDDIGAEARARSPPETWR
jgi:hypothetical protein